MPVIVLLVSIDIKINFKDNWMLKRPLKWIIMRGETEFIRLVGSEKYKGELRK